ncbi:hypothetical protein NPX13_g1842 [Xylaria arbuscula]|uniref:Ras-associating domain-containing protein n=1 Tax=Xylaria arbuscula TaxID=114810 RepID=A0A9W8TPQ7_9PEZI|nr:hypothetical protein NPX13_g1842 [Xylaria arbuscula]
MSSGRPLHTVYSQCVISFQEFLVKCSRDHNFQGNEGLEKCYEEYSRLKIWGHQRKAALGPSVPGSLAATLLDHPELENTILEIYDQIIQSFDRQTQSYTSDNSESFDGSIDPSGMVECIFENIEELYRLNSLVRRPRLTGRYLHSTRSNISHASQEEIQHIREKFLSWQKGRREQLIEEESEEIATPELIAKRKHVEESDKPLELVLSRRLAVANMKRRSQLRYWEVHPYQIDSEPTPATLHAGSSSIRDSTGPLSTVFTFSSVARSAIIVDEFKHNKDEDIRTIYASSLAGNSESLRVPDLPAQDESKTSLECPYCHMSLALNEMKDRNNWKRHVFRDLRPYICTFSDCLDPDRLFATRRDWVYHEMQLHRRQWICQQCACGYASKSEITNHIRRNHQFNITDRELAILLDMSERPNDEGNHDRCPFCHATMSTRKLLDHIAGHMEELALFSLPRNLVDEETEDGPPRVDFQSQIQGDLPPLQTPEPETAESSSQIETLKQLHLRMDDPCSKVLPVALKKYHINAPPDQYSLYIEYNNQQRRLGLEEKPLILFKQLEKEGKKPMFKLRRSLLQGNLQPTPTPVPEMPRSTLSEEENFQKVRVAMDDPYSEVLAAALKKHKLDGPWDQYELYIVYDEQERRLGLEEKPLVLVKQLEKEGKRPTVMIRKKSRTQADVQIPRIAGSSSSSNRDGVHFSPDGFI